MASEAALKKTTASIKIIRLLPSVPLSATRTATHKNYRLLCKQPKGNLSLRRFFSASLVMTMT